MNTNHSQLRRNLFEYSDERATVYDNNFIGTGAASISDSNACREEVTTISRLLPNYIGGEHIDLACGTGFWIPFYEKNCSAITIIDQSKKMLYECSKRIERLGIENKVETICDDLFNYPSELGKYDSALLGFVLSLLWEEQEKNLFDILKKILRPGGKFIVLDSAWSRERANAFTKTGIQKRTVNERAFEIYKRYFEKKDFDCLAEKYGISFTVIHEGRAFIVAVGNAA